MTEKYLGEGGSYEMRDGKRVRVTAPTQPTDTGGARDADGKPIEQPQEAAVAAAPAPATKTSRIRAADTE